MANATPNPCTPDNCGDLFPKCGKRGTYVSGCRCDECRRAQREYNKAHAKANPEPYRARARAYRENHLDERREYNKQHRKENREMYREAWRRQYYRDVETSRAKKTAYRAANIEKNREYQARYFERYEQEIRERRQEYAKQHPERIRKSKRKWKAENPEAVRQHRRLRRAREIAATTVPFSSEQLDQRMAYYGYRCYLNLPGVCTGAFDDVEHVKPLSKGGPHMLANLRPACDPCNTRKFNKWPFPAVTSRVGC